MDTNSEKRRDMEDIVVYEAVDLSQWLDNSSAVAIWFAVHLGNLPSDVVFDADQFWSEWSEGPHCILTPQTITAGREAEIENLLTFLTGEPGIKAKTKTEAIAFIVPSLTNLENNFLPKN